VSGQQTPGPSGKSHLARNIAVLVVVLVIIAASYLALSYAGIAVVQKKTVTTVIYSTTEVPQTFSSNVVNGIIAVNAGNYQSYRVTAPTGAYNLQLSGSFTASGGSGNDIVVLIMDETNYVNWQNGHQASAYYNSGQVTTKSFSVNLPTGGAYYLVYSNTFSTFSDKNVNTQANLGYTQNVQTVISYTSSYVSP
jgi:hypothetical protein